MSPFRPDLVDVWMFRERAAAGDSKDGAFAATARGERAAAPGIEILMLRRSPGRILPGLWQCVSGSLEPGEPVPAGALRELREETGFGPGRIAGFYDLDQVNQFHEPSVGAVLTAVVFAVRLRPHSEPVLSREHDDMRWTTPDEATALAVWPAYRESIVRITDNLVDPERATWFELTLDGRRARV